MKTVKAYKVVSIERDKLTSLSFRLGDPACVVYKPQEWVRAPLAMRKRGYWLYVFADLTDVQKFFMMDKFAIAKEAYDIELWECEALDLHVPMANRLDVDDVNMLTAGTLRKPRGWYRSWPDGTLMARAVRLTKPVPWETLDNLPKVVY